MLVDIATWENRVYQDCVGLNSEQDSEAADSDFSLRASIHEVIGRPSGIFERLHQCLLNTRLCRIVESLQVTCGLLAKFEGGGRGAQKSRSMTSKSPRAI